MLRDWRCIASHSVLAVFFCLVFLSGSEGCYAQGTKAGATKNSSKASPYTIPITVRRVVLDVVVTDARGKPVHGLRQKDFSVFEDETKQEIRSFEEMDSRSSQNFVAPKIPPMPANTYTDVATTPEWGALYIIVYDMPDMVLSDQVWARKELAKFLAEKPEGARFALFVVAEDVHLVQGFSTDRSQLLKAFDVARKQENLPWVFLYAGNYPSEPFQVLAFLGRYLEGLPGRKNVIWLSSHFPIDIPEWEIPNMRGGAKDLGGGYKPSPGTMGESYDEKVMREAIDLIDTSQISLYPVDVSGVGKKPDQDAMDAARVTGGRASQTNDLAADLLDATEDGASYYEISYAPSAPDYDGKMRKIRVKVAHRNYGLEYRRYYFADEPNAPLTDDEKKVAAAVADQVVAHRAGDSMFAYMEHGAPEAHDILFRAQFHAGPAAMATPDQMANLVQQPAYFVVRKNNNKPVKLPPPIPLRPYTIDYLVVDRTAGQQAGGQVLEFAAGAYDINGKLLNGLSQNAVRAASGEKAQPFFRAQQTLEVPTTAAWLRVAVRDVNTDRIGTLEIPLPLAQDQRASAQKR